MADAAFPGEPPKAASDDPGAETQGGHCNVGDAIDEKTVGGKAVGALVCGILAIVFSPTIVVGIALGIVAVVLGVLFRKQHPEKPKAKATGGIVCGAIGIVVSLLLLAAVAAFVYYAVQSSDSDVLGSYVAEMGTEDDEDAVRSAAEEALQAAISPSNDAKAQAADELDQEFSQATGMSLADAGIDKDEVVSWFVEDASYSIENVVVTGNSATVKVVLTVRDEDAFEDAVSTRVSEYLELNGANGATSTGQIAQQIAQYITEAMDSTGMVEDTEYLVVEKQDGSWSVDDSSIESVQDAVIGL